MKNRKIATSIRFIAIVLLIAAVSTMVIAAYLLYKNSFDSMIFSNWLFYAGIAYIAIGIVPLYNVITSSNSVSYTYGEYAVKGKVDNQNRIDEALSKKSHSFSILMISAGLLLFFGAFLAERFL
jgi:uncharacterized membrane protein HdeD (DUF308 family)